MFGGSDWEVRLSITASEATRSNELLRALRKLEDEAEVSFVRYLGHHRDMVLLTFAAPGHSRGDARAAARRFAVALQKRGFRATEWKTYKRLPNVYPSCYC